MTKALGLSVLFLSFLIGFVPQSAAEPLMMFPFVLLSGWMMASGSLLRLHGQDPFLLVLLLLWVLWSLSAALSPAPFPSKVTWVIMGTLPLSYMAWTTLSLSVKDWERMSRGGAFVFSILALWAILQILPLPFSPHLPRAERPFADANLLGAILGMGFLLSLPSLFVSSSRIFAVPLLLILGGVFATQSRSAILGLCAALPLFLIFWKKSKTESSPSIKKISLAIASLMVALALAVGLADRLLPLFQSGGDKDLNARFALWEAGLKMSLLHPFSGLGLGTFHLHYPPFRLPADISAGWWVHMDPLQEAIESGWGAFLLLYSLFGLVLLRIIQKPSAPQNLLAAPALLLFFIVMHAGYPLHVVPFMILFTGFLSQFSGPRVPLSQPLGFFLATPLLLVLMTGLWVTLQTSSTLFLYREVNLASHSQDEARFQKSMSACLEDGDHSFPDCRLLAARLLIGQSGTSPLSPAIFKLLEEAEAANPLSPEPAYLRTKALQKLQSHSNQSIQQGPIK